MEVYEFHPLAKLFPIMSDQEHREPVADINQGKLLDRCNRFDHKPLRFLMCAGVPS
jgi:hypothetical protein